MKKDTLYWTENEILQMVQIAKSANKRMNDAARIALEDSREANKIKADREAGICALVVNDLVTIVEQLMADNIKSRDLCRRAAIRFNGFIQHRQAYPPSIRQLITELEDYANGYKP